MQESKLIRSREEWRNKAKQRREGNKSLKKSLAASRKSRDYWKDRCMSVEHQLEQVEEELSEEKKRNQASRS